MWKQMVRLTHLDYNGLYWSLFFIGMRGLAQWIALLEGERTALFLPVALLALQWGLVGVFLFINDNFGPTDGSHDEFWVSQWGMALTLGLIFCTSLLFVWMGYDRVSVGLDLIGIPILATVWLWAQTVVDDEAQSAV